MGAPGVWRVYGPTEAGPQKWGTGGELTIWESRDEGAHWTQVREITRNSPRNHGYVRHPVNAHVFHEALLDGASRIAVRAQTTVWSLMF